MIGVGTQIHNILASNGIKVNETCACEDLRKEMDHRTPEYIEENVEIYAHKMKLSIQRWRGSKPIPIPPKAVLIKFIKYACNKSKQSRLDQTPNP